MNPTPVQQQNEPAPPSLADLRRERRTLKKQRASAAQRLSEASARHRAEPHATQETLSRALQPLNVELRRLAARTGELDRQIAAAEPTDLDEASRQVEKAREYCARIIAALASARAEAADVQEEAREEQLRVDATQLRARLDGGPAPSRAELSRLRTLAVEMDEHEAFLLDTLEDAEQELAETERAERAAGSTERENQAFQAWRELEAAIAKLPILTVAELRRLHGGRRFRIEDELGSRGVELTHVQAAGRDAWQLTFPQVRK